VREAQIYVKTKHAWQKNIFSAEAVYQPSVYKASVEVETAKLDSESKAELEQAILRVLEDTFKADFKIIFERTEERHGFLETKSLEKLEEKLKRRVLTVIQRRGAVSYGVSID
jgi:hypothetical protein